MMRIIALALLFSVASVALAQDMTPNPPSVVIRGSVVIGNCLQWIDAHTIADSGVAC
jgi:NhaP-type Na+/H+ or K+/H+ antiporter